MPISFANNEFVGQSDMKQTELESDGKLAS